ncbi:hypothetical protein DFQ01_12254 [Paenibacillus cellulosilyticus]|uniref:Uncharacterized protein n=1 Tax=Paenibacillus cellulosilyticus TaxID=375489 RepID=A0A2V2YXI5_9BACL|nr:hypothetical protein [Paenibacillus cellulosilyticus]PWV97323.1 hypothetical protein DFQ01_12254 [Paenibacillus cellulosilyticus]QKS47477.1 hypothetical protein HUB94_24125 [Paenibacillus cellulosilyticus]
MPINVGTFEKLNGQPFAILLAGLNELTSAGAHTDGKKDRDRCSLQLAVNGCSRA